MDNSRASDKQKIKQNPFIYGKPVRISDFFNRDETVEDLLALTITGTMQKDLWITGERQVGKTSLLKYIQVKSRTKNFAGKIKFYETGESLDASFIYVNTQATKSGAEFFRDMYDCLKEEDEFHSRIEPSDNSTLDLIESLKDLYSREKRYIVFMVDEFDAMIRNLAVNDPNVATLFLSELNTLLEGTHKRMDGKIFGCIFASNRTLGDLLKEYDIEGSGSGINVDNIYLPWFSKEQIGELANQYLKNNYIRFSGMEIGLCFKMTQGYPYFVQQFFHIMYNQKLEDPDSKSYISKVKEEYGKNFKETVKLWSGTNMPERTLQKINSLVKDIIKQIGDRSLSLVFKSIEEFIKMQI